MPSETEKHTRGPLKLPRLKGEALDFAETILSIGMPYKYAVRAFLDSFPAYAEHEDLTEAEIFEILKNRFKEMRCQTRRLSYQNIKETEASLKKLLDCIPVASPLVRLMELEKMRQNPDAINMDLIKVLGAAAQESQRLMPRERTSPFSGLPDLIPTHTSGSETPQKAGAASDPFGGAMINHAHTGQETSKDS